eukprot:8432597-Heterocapsa_arctica.AAC.1
MQETKEQEGMTESHFWNMILHTQNFVTHKYYYNVKYWPNIGIAMIKAAPETEEEAESETRKERGQG